MFLTLPAKGAVVVVYYLDRSSDERDLIFLGMEKLLRGFDFLDGVVALGGLKFLATEQTLDF